MLLLEHSAILLTFIKLQFSTALSIRSSPNADQNYCRMLQGEHSAIFLTFIKLPFPTKTFVLSIFKWPLKTGFTEQCIFFGITLI